MILIGQRTAELAKNDVEVREIDLLRVKGKNEPVVVFELLGRKDRSPKPNDASSTGTWRARRVQAARLRDGLGQIYRGGRFGSGGRAITGLCGTVCQYRQAPPPPAWDGVYEMTSK